MEYRIDQAKREAFLHAIAGLEQQRRRDGAYAWDLFEDAAVNGRYLETFKVASWLEHLRPHQRVTNADRAIGCAIKRAHSPAAIRSRRTGFGQSWLRGALWGPI
ncbi:MFS transporter [Bradyrhizobium sp. ERR14]|uniref:MFS transporter n=1 Tax=Bradyrhizobium sp. ERR14 TaxID=2663837 RepID=UPI002897BF9A|nr:MFS transporter [Bradyrhizobium sp. ERR14]